MPVGEYGEYSPSFIEAVEDYLRSGQSSTDLYKAANKAATGVTGPARRDAVSKMRSMMESFLAQAQEDPSIIADFINFQRSKLGDAVASGEDRVPAREALKNLRDIQALLTEQRQFPESGEAPETTADLLARLESPEMEAEREKALADVKPDPAAKYTEAVSADDYYNADKRMAQKRREFTDATGIEVDDDEDFTVDPPESDAQVAERIKADKMLAETKAAGEKMKADREAARKAAASAAKTTAETTADLAAKKMIKGPTKLDPKTGKPLESGSGLLKGPDKFDPANKTEIIPAELDPEYFPGGVLTDEGFGRQARDRRRKEEESAAVARRKEAGLPPLSPSEALRVEGEAHAEAMQKGFDSLSYDDPIWLGEKPAAEPTGLATAAPVPAKAEVLPISEDDEALRLFRVAHGGAFDPKSSMDKRKIDEVRQLLAEQGGQGDMTDNQFALKLYRKFDYV